MSESRKTKVGVVGVGSLGQWHARVYSELPGAELVGVYDINARRAQDIAARYKTKVFNDYNELASQVDAASIVVPADKHHEVAVKMMACGVNLLIEKPIAVTTAEAEQLVSAARERKLILQVGHIERFNPVMKFLESVLTCPRFIEAHRLQPYPAPPLFGGKPRGTEVSVVLDLMIHDLEVILHLVRSPVKEIRAVGVPVLSKSEDIANVRLAFENGCVANVTTSRISPEAVRKIRVFQEDAYISLDYQRQAGEIYRRQAGRIERNKVPIEKGDALENELASFIDCVRTQSSPVVSGEHAAAALCLAADICRQIRDHASSMKNKSVMIIAGEISGDLHAAALVRVVRQRAGNIHFFGIGGDELEKAGMEICRHTRDMAVLGLSEVLRKYFFFRKTFQAMLTLLRKRRPDVVLLVDYPGFNLPFAKAAHKLGIKVIYYICPQVWAWRRGRIPAMAKSVDRLIAIFPFEAEIFKGTGLRVDFVGHPLVSAAAARAEPLFPLPWNDEKHIAILPGSRRQEIKLILPAMVSAAVLLKKKITNANFIIAAASHAAALWIEEVLASIGMTGQFAVMVDKTRQILRQADAAWVASGTATIETALMECPMAVVYRTALLTYLAGRMLIRVPFLGMVNIVAGKKICPELIQGDATPKNLVRAIEPLISEGAPRNEMIGELKRVREILGSVGAEERAAEIVLQELL